MMSSTIANALAASNSSQRQDASSSSPAATDASSDSASFSSAMANAQAASPTDDASNPEGGDAPKQTPADTVPGEAAANAQTAIEAVSSGEKSGSANATSRTAATGRVVLSTQRAPALARALNTVKSPVPLGHAIVAQAGDSANRQTSAKDESDKPTSSSEALKSSTAPTTETSAPVCGNILAPTDTSVGAFVQAAAAQTIRPEPSATVAGDRAALPPSSEAIVLGLGASDRVDANTAEGPFAAQGQTQAVPAAGLLAGVNASATNTVQSFATLFARPAKAEGESANGNAPETIGDSVLANGGTPLGSSSTAALTSLAGAPIHAGAALGLGPAQVNVATRVGDSGFGLDVSRQLVLLAKTGAQSAQLSLQPAELGPVNVSIQMNGLQASLVISASHAATRAALQEALPHLGELFQSSGLQLADAQVGDGSARNADQGATQRQALGVNDPLNVPAMTRATAIGVDVVAGNRIAGSRLIDTFA